MKRYRVIFLLGCGVVGLSLLMGGGMHQQACAAQLKPYAAPAPAVKAPEGTVLKPNKVVVQKGYLIEPRGEATAVVMKKASGEITGTFERACRSNGGCKVGITPSTITCEAQKCSECFLVVSIPEALMQKKLLQ